MFCTGNKEYVNALRQDEHWREIQKLFAGLALLKTAGFRPALCRATLLPAMAKSVWRIPIISAIHDRLDDWNANQELRRLRKLYAPKVAEAEKAKDEAERDSLLSEWQLESDLTLDPLNARRAERLAAKARRYDISVPRKPLRYDEDSDDWELSNVAGDWLMTKQLERHLRREIRSERRARSDEFRKWATLIFALLGFALGFYSLRIKQKQPDPCTRNYYRNDSGQCVFALQPPTQSQVPAKP
jgi:hypothetical protein